MKRSNLILRLTAFCLILIVLTAGAAGAASTDLEKKLDELNQIEKQILDKRNLLTSTKKQETNVLNEIKKLENDLAKTKKELSKLEGQLAEVTESIATATRELKEAEEKLAQRQDYLGRRLRAIHENGTVSLLDVLLAANDFSDFVNRYSFLQAIVQQDVQLLHQVKAEKAQIAERKQKLETQQVQLTKITQATAEKRSAVETRTNEREKLLSQIQKDRKAYEAALNELEKTSRELETIIRNLSGSNSGKAPTPKTLIWPVKGKISSIYGNRYHPILKAWKLHTGIDIGVPRGTPVKAAYGGTVIVSKSLSGYGNTVIIDHGGGVSTLYAHNDSLAVKVGAKVNQGDVVAKCGSTGYSTGPHVHFEVRVNGGAVNPAKWLP